MTISLCVFAILVITLLSVVYWQNQTFIAELQSSRASYLSASSAHDQSYIRVIESLQADANRREAGLRGEIQALTEALGRSKDSVPVVYPRDPDQPLEQSSGWFDGRPEIRSSVKVRE